MLNVIYKCDGFFFFFFFLLLWLVFKNYLLMAFDKRTNNSLRKTKNKKPKFGGKAKQNEKQTKNKQKKCKQSWTVTSDKCATEIRTKNMYLILFMDIFFH